MIARFIELLSILRTAYRHWKLLPKLQTINAYRIRCWDGMSAPMELSGSSKSLSISFDDPFAIVQLGTSFIPVSYCHNVEMSLKVSGCRYIDVGWRGVPAYLTEGRDPTVREAKDLFPPTGDGRSDPWAGAHKCMDRSNSHCASAKTE